MADKDQAPDYLKDAKKAANKFAARGDRKGYEDVMGAFDRHGRIGLVLVGAVLLVHAEERGREREASDRRAAMIRERWSGPVPVPAAGPGWGSVDEVETRQWYGGGSHNGGSVGAGTPFPRPPAPTGPPP